MRFHVFAFLLFVFFGLSANGVISPRTLLDNEFIEKSGEPTSGKTLVGGETNDQLALYHMSYVAEGFWKRLVKRCEWLAPRTSIEFYRAESEEFCREISLYLSYLRSHQSLGEVWGKKRTLRQGSGGVEHSSNQTFLLPDDLKRVERAIQFDLRTLLNLLGRKNISLQDKVEASVEAYSSLEVSDRKKLCRAFDNVHKWAHMYPGKPFSEQFRYLPRDHAALLAFDRYYKALLLRSNPDYGANQKNTSQQSCSVNLAKAELLDLLAKAPPVREN